VFFVNTASLKEAPFFPIIKIRPSNSDGNSGKKIKLRIRVFCMRFFAVGSVRAEVVHFHRLPLKHGLRRGNSGERLSAREARPISVTDAGSSEDTLFSRRLTLTILIVVFSRSLCCSTASELSTKVRNRRVGFCDR
jgi:hypothetical protein